MNVQFHDTDEFLSEVARDKNLVDRKILRVTVLRRYHSPFVHASVVATASISGTVVRLEHRLGECFNGDASGTATITKKAEAAMARIGREALNLGLEVRTGMYE